MKSNVIVRDIMILMVILVCFGIVPVAAQSYIGSEQCLVCHNGNIAVDRTGWRSSMHANGITVPEGAHSMENLYGIVVDADQNGTDDFKDGLNLSTVSAFEAYGSNAPVLGYDATNDEYTITIGDLALAVKLTYGGSGLYKQRFIVKVPVSGGGLTAGHYVSPVQYNEKTHEYVAYHPEAWYGEDDAPLFNTSTTAADIAASANTVKRSFEKQCIGCHFTHVESVSQNSDDEWVADAPNAGTMDAGNSVYDIDGDGTADLINTGCERCHGPGSTHMSSQSPDDIINPEDLTAQQANDMCGFCHSRGSSVPNGTFHYPYNDADMHDWETGDVWGDYYSDHGGYYGDGMHEGEIKSSKKHHQQYFDFYESSKPTFIYHEVRCYECHDVHNDVKHHMREEIVEEDSEGNELVIATDNDDNTLCLACHSTHGAFADLTKEMIADPVTYADTIATVVTRHTRHGYSPDSGTNESRCSKCHNPKTIKSAVYYDIHSHTFEPISPQKTLEYSMPNACAASCHRALENGDSPVFGTGSDESLTVWNEEADIALADTLLHYFGPGGIWWDVDQILAIVEWVNGVIPDGFQLMQNYPNPFNPSTVIPLKIRVEGNVEVVLFNVLGQEVAKLMNRYLSQGEYRIVVNAESLSSGVYFYRMTVTSSEGDLFSDQKKMVVMK